MKYTIPENLPPAHRFRCELTRKEIREKLNEKGPWNGLGGDSEYDGLYLRAVPKSGTKLRILGEMPPNYVIEIFLNRKLVKELTLNELHQTVMAELLPSISAIDIKPLQNPY